MGPSGLTIADNDWLIVTSHDCDVVNDRLEKEPIVEILRAEAVNRTSPDKQQAWGRNPRSMHLEVQDRVGTPVVLSLKVHERWTLARDLLCTEAPVHVIGLKERRLIAEWLAKRYIRAAFPTAFDDRWRTKMRDWTNILEKHSRWIQGVYLRLSTMNELDEADPYKVHLIVAAPTTAKKDVGWSSTRDAIDRDIETFWKQFAPGIECVGVEVLGTDQLTLADIELYQRFDADWVSFADDSPSTPAAADMRK